MPGEIMDVLLDTLDKHANLVLILVTAVYVILTWFIVRETRRAREAATEPYLVATLLPTDRRGRLVFLRVHNVGGRPAFNIEAEVRFIPARATGPIKVRHAVLFA